MKPTTKQDAKFAEMYSIDYKEPKREENENSFVGATIKEYRQDKKTSEVVLVTDKGVLLLGAYVEGGEAYIVTGKL